MSGLKPADLSNRCLAPVLWLQVTNRVDFYLEYLHLSLVQVTCTGALSLWVLKVLKSSACFSGQHYCLPNLIVSSI